MMQDHHHPMKPAHLLTLLFATAVSLQAVTPEGKQKLVFIAGKPSHPPGMHEFRAGTMLLEQCLKSVPNLVVDRHEMGWVSDEKTFEDADAVVIYADGGGKHPAVVDGHLETLRKLIAKGVGFGCMPPLAATALQNNVSIHTFGSAVATMQFSRNLFATILVAVFAIFHGYAHGQELPVAQTQVLMADAQKSTAATVHAFSQIGVEILMQVLRLVEPDLVEHPCQE